MASSYSQARIYYNFLLHLITVSKSISTPYPYPYPLAIHSKTPYPHAIHSIHFPYPRASSGKPSLSLITYTLCGSLNLLSLGPPVGNHHCPSSHTLYVAASTSWVYITFTQCGSLNLMSLHHIYSMWQPQPHECTSHSTQCGNQKLMPYHYHYQTHIILHKTIQTIKYSCISLSLSVSKSNSLKIIPISQNHENILEKSWNPIWENYFT